MPTALITGASRGLGRACAISFAKAGWDLYLVARDETALLSLSKKLSNTKSKISYESIDFSQPKNIEPGLEKLLSRGLPPNVLINNAGVAWTGELITMPLESWQWIFQINLTSVFQVCSKVVPLMRNSGGLIINVSSHASRNAFAEWGAYCVSKAALASFTKCLAEEERQYSIRACTLTLGSVNTSIWDSDTVKSGFNRDAMLQVEQAANELLHLANQPSNQVIEDLTLMPASGAF
ncbi:SDR family oxidoreductase [Prochlorococcus sp. MIT 1223]|uniref:SDR family oxidoreductase n=1 Tax=Prochlorococcus sp. MIT 1223 TaxID=3096217 RepID=UPI002A7494DC|nr:SDR family oxidoreductase [Prochlorococcus sp. MIT 1223]